MKRRSETTCSAWRSQNGVSIVSCSDRTGSVERFLALDTVLQVNGFVIVGSSLPNFPGDGQQAVGETAVGMANRMAASKDLVSVGSGPVRLLCGTASPLLGNVAESMVTTAAKAD